MSRRMGCKWTSACNGPIATREAGAKARLFGARKAATNAKPSAANCECVPPSSKGTDTDIGRVDPDARWLDAEIIYIDANADCIDAAFVCFDALIICSAASSHCLSDRIVCMDAPFMRRAILASKGGAEHKQNTARSAPHSRRERDSRADPGAYRLCFPSARLWRLPFPAPHWQPEPNPPRMPQSPDFRYEVFPNHNHADKPPVRRLAKRLKAAGVPMEAGLRLWWDEWVIQAGDIIALKVDEELEQSRVLLLCISPAALASGWVALERSTAVHRDPANAGRRFIPLLLRDCALPDTLLRYKYVDFRGESEAAFAEVLATLRDTLLPKLLSGELATRALTGTL